MPKSPPTGSPVGGPLEPAPWSSCELGAATAESVTALLGADPDGLSGRELVNAIVAAEKALSLLAGVQMRLQAALAVPFTAGDPMRLAARLARKSCATGDENPAQVQLFVPEAATSLAAAEIAAALRISPVTAGIKVRDAETMTTVLAPTLMALEAGTVDRGKAKIIAEHCAPLNPEHTAAVQRLVLDKAAVLSNGELRDVTGQAVIIVDPDGTKDRHDQAAARRALVLNALPDAMACLRATLPADGAVKIFQLGDLLATGTAGAPDDPRGIGARRVDAWVDVAEQLLTHGHLDLTGYFGKPLPDHGHPRPRPSRYTEGDDFDALNKDLDAINDGSAGAISRSPTASFVGPAQPAGDDPFEPGDTSWAALDEGADPDAGDGAGQNVPAPADLNDYSTAGAGDRAGREVERERRSLTRQGRRPHLSVVIGVETLAGLDDLPGYLAGYGAIPAGIARSIAASAATMTAITADPTTGAVTGAGALTYRPRQELRDQITALMATCQFPSCRQPSWRCDIDHQQPFNHRHPEQGGPTSPRNTTPLCRRHHLFKHHAGWSVHVDPADFTVSWTSPTGHRYTKNGQQRGTPRIWVTTPGSTAAERLDDLRATRATTAAPIAAPTTNRTTGPDGADAGTVAPMTTPPVGDAAEHSAQAGISRLTADTEQGGWGPGRDSIEALLGDHFLRNNLSRAAIEYDADPAAWETGTGDHPSLRLTKTDESADGDEPPPF